MVNANKLGQVQAMFFQKRNYAQRCAEVFLETNRTVRAEVGSIIAKHAADGLSRSGATIRRSIEAFERLNTVSVETLHAEFAALHHARGREWTRAMEAVRIAIEGQFRSARHVLERPFTIAAGKVGQPAEPGTAINRAIEDELRGSKERLLRKHKAFADGWTAPPGKPWHERHPIIYGALAALGGALLTAALAVLIAPQSTP